MHLGFRLVLKTLLAIALLDKKAEVIDIVYGLHAWLQKHPSETIVVSLKVDNGDPAGEEVQRLMGELLEETKTCWVENVSTVRPPSCIPVALY